MARAEKAKWTRLATLGLLMAGLAPVMFVAASLIWGLDTGGELGFFFVTTAIALVGALLVWQFGAWSKFVGIVAAVMLAMALFWTAFGLFQPASFFDFVPGTLLIPGALIAIVGCISALVAKRRGHLAASAEGGEKRAIRIVGGIVVVLAIASGAMNLFLRPTAEATDAEATAIQRDFKFDKDQYEVSGGGKIFVSNDDPFAHTFTIDALEIDEVFVAGSSKVIDIPADAGTYVLYCKPHTEDKKKPKEDDMAATLLVS